MNEACDIDGREEICVQGFGRKSCWARDHLERFRADLRVILKLVLKIEARTVWITCVCLRIRASDGHFEQHNDLSGSRQYWDLIIIIIIII
jgi:hypothetical protein